MIHEVIFDSTDYSDEKIVTLACGHISITKINFINEGLFIVIEAKKGEIDFWDSESVKVLSTTIPTPLTGDEKFSEVKCGVENGMIKLGFPKYTYEDNYPNCDGEYDRWTKTISGFDYIRYDIKNNMIVK